MKGGRTARLQSQQVRSHRSSAIRQDARRREVILLTEEGRRVRKEVGKGSFIPTLLLTSPFPASTLTLPSGVVCVSKAGMRVTPLPGVNQRTHFLAGEPEHVTHMSPL